MDPAVSVLLAPVNDVLLFAVCSDNPSNSELIGSQRSVVGFHPTIVRFDSLLPVKAPTPELAFQVSVILTDAAPLISQYSFVLTKLKLEALVAEGNGPPTGSTGKFPPAMLEVMAVVGLTP